MLTISESIHQIKHLGNTLAKSGKFLNECVHFRYIGQVELLTLALLRMLLALLFIWRAADDLIEIASIKGLPLQTSAQRGHFVHLFFCVISNMMVSHSWSSITFTNWIGVLPWTWRPDYHTDWGPWRKHWRSGAETPPWYTGFCSDYQAKGAWHYSSYWTVDTSASAQPRPGIRPKLHRIPYLVHYFCPEPIGDPIGLWSKVVH